MSGTKRLMHDIVLGTAKLYISFQGLKFGGNWLLFTQSRCLTRYNTFDCLKQVVLHETLFPIHWTTCEPTCLKWQYFPETSALLQPPPHTHPTPPPLAVLRKWILISDYNLNLLIFKHRSYLIAHSTHFYTVISVIDFRMSRHWPGTYANELWYIHSIYTRHLSITCFMI